MRLVLVGCLLSLMASAEQPIREISTQATPFPKSIVPRFRHGYLILFPPGGGNGSPVAQVMFGFYAYGPDGLPVYQTNIQVPGGSQPVVRDVDFDGDGTAAVGVNAAGGVSGFLAGIIRLDRMGGEGVFIDTGRYTPAHIAIAPDHSIWTLGWQWDMDKPPSPDKQDYMIVHHFSADGKQLGAYLPRSLFPAGLEPGIPGAGVHIEVSANRIGLLVYSGKTGVSTEWVELDLDGNVLSRSRLDGVVRGVSVAAFTGDNHVYLANLNGNVYTRDAKSQAWTQIPNQSAGILMGADGNDLVYRHQENHGAIQLQWFNQPKP